VYYTPENKQHGDAYFIGNNNLRDFFFCPAREILTVLGEHKPPPRRLTSTDSDSGFEFGFPD